MRERYPDGRVNIIMAAKFVVSSRYRDRRQTNEKKKRRRKKTEIAPGEFQSQCMFSGRRMMDRERERAREREREEESLNAYTYHHLACLPINF